ncbi:3-phosphoshikimate 1-carboxyvinyltransferase [Blastococcus sp. Marseille-P5729]|uniref:3-phosphoshikimate 1-carboxyvinyltransferase n=1 Tax=Blastococcus sp. Marseille-P5729 TaxID=2086582 RepID=UPI000D0F5FD6|nr:3-phosphoshikimate 1-carboxyvinyltransferase [Blastococcus sp. Marseille-P5729]
MSSQAIPWTLPWTGSAVEGTVPVAGSKSLMARSLVLSAIADGQSAIANPLRSRDSLLMADALVGLGATVEPADDAWTITPGQADGPVKVDCGLSGTVMRFVPSLAALRDGPTHFDGDPHARTRPMGPLIDGLRQAGATIEDGGRGLLPLKVIGNGRVRGGAATVDASGSSQFISGLLLSAARFEQGLHITPSGAVPNRGHIRMTLGALRERGVDAEELPDGAWRVLAGPVQARDVTIEPDASNSAPFLCAAAATGGTVTIPHWPLDTAQPIRTLLEVLEEYGANTRFDESGITVTGGERRGIDVDLADVGDMTPVVAAMCLAADSPSRIRGVAYIRGHETDRLRALAVELSKLGADVSETEDGLSIIPHPLHKANLASYADHRMVHAAAVAGLLVEGVHIDDVATTAKAMPQFAALWSELLTGDPTGAPEVSETAR